MTDGKQGAIGIRRITFEQGRIIVFRYNGAIPHGFLPWPRFLGAYCKANPVQRFRKYLIQKELVALTGIEPGFAAFQRYQ